MKKYKADLHIHTCLSPCSDLEMGPTAIVEESLAKGLDIIAICDHNSAENSDAVIQVGVKKGLHVFPGMEINSKEEVHVLGLFKTQKKAMAMQEIVYSHLTEKNRPEYFGEQIIVNEFDEIDGVQDLMLIGATTLGLTEIVDTIHNLGGLAIASHVDRPSYSVLSQLGFIPSDLKLDAIEISSRVDMKSLHTQIPDVEKFPVVTSSDAHFLKDIGSVSTSFFIEVPDLENIRLALNNKSGRRVIH